MSRKDVENARLALKHRLYSQPTFQLIDLLRDVVRNDSAKVVLHCNDEGVPVGVAVRTKGRQMIQVFVRKACRGQGIGSKLVSQLKTKHSWGSSSSISQGKIFRFNGVTVKW